jgi:hypothetical protein
MHLLENPKFGTFVWEQTKFQIICRIVATSEIEISV